MSISNTNGVVDPTHLGPGQDLDFAIIGGGFSGISMAIKLLQSGEKNFLLFERESEIGGTWYANRYPGAGCDIESNLYSLRVSPNKHWSRKFAKRDEIHAYMLDCAEQFGIRAHVRCKHELITATWDDNMHRWVLLTDKGNWTAKVLVNATGYLSEPKYPNIDGLDTFDGPVVHTGAWDNEMDLTDKVVAIIGTGSSAVQAIPEIQPIAKQLNVFQRSAGWVAPKHDKPHGSFEAWAMEKLPGYQRMKRFITFCISESHVWFMRKPKRMGVPQKEVKQHLKKSVSDPVLREKLHPDHVVGCKRYLFSNDYYPAMQEANVNLITGGVQSVVADGIINEDGTQYSADVIVLATGFKTTKSGFAERLIGKTGETLAETWRDGQFAYLGMNVPGFPNMFVILGPNSAVAHTSSTLNMEHQVNCAMKMYRLMEEQNVSSIDIRPEVIDDLNRDIQKAIAGGIWAAGCSSWYIDENGRNTALWPFSTIKFGRMARRVDLSKYLVRRLSDQDSNHGKELNSIAVQEPVYTEA